MKAVMYLFFGLAIGYFCITAFHAITYLLFRSPAEPTLDAIEFGLIRFLVCLGFGLFLVFIETLDDHDE